MKLPIQLSIVVTMGILIVVSFAEMTKLDHENQLLKAENRSYKAALDDLMKADARLKAADDNLKRVFDESRRVMSEGDAAVKYSGQVLARCMDTLRDGVKQMQDLRQRVQKLNESFPAKCVTFNGDPCDLKTAIGCLCYPYVGEAK